VELRGELLPPAVPAERLEELGREIERIEALLSNDWEAGSRAVDAFNAATGHAYEPSDFLGRYESRDLDEFALEAARPAWPRVADITVEELAEIVRRIVRSCRLTGRSPCERPLRIDRNPGRYAKALRRGRAERNDRAHADLHRSRRYAARLPLPG
jgi:hypothetical protein